MPMANYYLDELSTLQKAFEIQAFSAFLSFISVHPHEISSVIFQHVKNSWIDADSVTLPDSRARCRTGWTRPCRSTSVSYLQPSEAHLTDGIQR